MSSRPLPDVSAIEECSASKATAPVRFVAPLVLLVAFAAICAHAYRLASIPRGFYIDESSIGYNAWLIATTGHDEHGVAWPLYFRAFGEYKNPFHIYALAAIYRLFGLSESATRAASGVAWLLGSIILYDVCARLASDPRLRLYAAVCVGFTPWLFALSRVSFELIWLYPLLAAYLWASLAAYERRSARWAVVAGVAIGLSAYAYSTFRLLAPLHVLALLFAYPRREYWPRHASMLAGFAIVLLPLAVYAGRQWAALSGRFGLLTYVNEPGWTLADKMLAFASRYAGYFSPDFLGLHGDANLRHHTGFGGELLLVTVALGGAGLVLGLRRGASAFMRLITLGVLVAPIAAALTRDHGHSLRAFSMVVFAIPLSVAAATLIRVRAAPALMGLIAACAALQAGAYVVHYFFVYPRQSIAAFESYGFAQALHFAQQNTRGRVIVDERQNQPYIQILFERALREQRGEVDAHGQSAVLGSAADLRPGELFIVYDPSFACADCRTGLPKNGLYGVVDAARETSP